MEKQRLLDQATWDSQQQATATVGADGVMVTRMPEAEIERIRDMLLDRTMWSQMADRREKIGPAMADKWDAYRGAVDDEARLARLEKRSPAWPLEPT